MKHGQSEEPTLFSPQDIYDMPDFPHRNRSANKVFINTILNAESRETAARSISTAHYYWDLFEEEWVYETYYSNESRQGLPVWPEAPLRLAEDYIESFLFRHPSFHNVAFKGLWKDLQLMDSSIMEEAIFKATELKIPVLPANNEIVVPISKKNQIKQILIDSFHLVTQNKFSNHEPKMIWSTI